MLFASLVVLTVVAGQEPENCRVVEMDPRRGPPRQTICQDARGQWIARPEVPADLAREGSPGGSSVDALPPEWRGRIRYSGTHEGYVQTASAMRDLSLEGAVRALNGQRRQYGGTLEMDLTFDGRAVSGTVSGTGGISTSRLRGTREGSRCRLTVDDVALLEAECTRAALTGISRNRSDSSDTMVMRIEARAISVVDAAEQERQQLAAAAAAETRRQAAQAERDRAEAADRARIAALPAASAAQARLLAEAVRQDSGAWLVNEFDAGSMVNVRVAGRDGAATTLRGEYTFNGGRPGWVEARVTGGRIECLDYWDMSGCAPVRTPGERATSPGAAVTGEGRPAVDTSGSRDCLRYYDLGGSSRDVYRSQGDGVLTRGGDYGGSVRTGGRFAYRNICRRSAEYRIDVGWGEQRSFTIEAGAEHRWRCHYQTGENLLGMATSQRASCVRE